MSLKPYKNLGSLVCEMADILRPPERLTVSQAATKYRYLNNPGSYVGPWTNDMTPYLVEVMDALADRRYNSVVFAGPAQCGKALCLSTPIPTPSGWTTMGDLKVGDFIFGADGNPCRVTFATEVMHDRDCYSVQFDDGSELIADAEHMWAVDDDHRPSAPRVVTTQEMIPTLKYGLKQRNRYAIPTSNALNLPDVELPIAPYTLGAWLGDGHSLGLRIYGSPCDLVEIENGVRNDGYETECRIDAKGLGVLDVDKSNRSGPGPRKEQIERSLLNRMRRVGLIKNSGGKKHIPKEYLRASGEQRAELLQGLMDTDGTVGKNGVCSFCTTDYSLALQVRELIVSLGLKGRLRAKNPSCTYKGEKVNGKTAWSIDFMAYDDQPVFKMGRKKDRQKTADSSARPSQVRRRRIVGITPVQSVPVRCITVDSPDHLYLAGDAMIPTHNTDAGVNWLLYTVICDPMDMIVFQTTNTAARDFSKRRIDRLHRHSPQVGSRLLPSATSDNVGQKIYRSGVMLSISWPAISEMSGRPVGRTWLTDLDRMTPDVDGEGSPFDLARARTRTFGANGTTFAESSPGYEVKDPKWIRQTLHEAPPCEGILAIYNRGDRRRWYWKCPHCGSWFEPAFELLKWTDTADIGEAAESTKMMCPHCASLIDQTERYKLNTNGKWLADNQRIDKDDVITGEAPRTGIASFWLKGPAATFSSWADLVQKYLLAEQEWLRTGSQEALKSTVNIDQGEPFYPRGAERERLPDELKAVAVSMPEREVPTDVRFLIATCDVQKNQWVVQVFGIAPGIDTPFRVYVIDRFDIRKSARKDADGDTLWVKPGSHLEDWDQVTEQVLGRTYPMADGSGTMGVAFTGCDSGGRAGVTAKAYEWFRKLRQFGNGVHQRLHLIKGEGRPDAPRAKISYPDAAKKDKKAIARGDVPVLFLNVNALKDELNNMLDRPGEDGGQFVYPDWLPDEWFKEMCSERRTAKGWENPVHSRNEAWDLATYVLGICRHRKVDRLNWDDAPDWASPPEDGRNPYFTPQPTGVDSTVAPKRGGGYNTLAELAERLA